MQEWTRTRPKRPIADSRLRGLNQRLAFIEFIAYWEGSIIRSKIVRRFGVSGECATSYFTAYKSIAPNNLIYDQTAKRYVAAERMSFNFIEPNAEEYLRQALELSNQTDVIDTWLTGSTKTEVTRFQVRPADPEILRRILKAIDSSRSIEVEYHSFGIGVEDAIWTRMSPHAIASDGLHWYIRAYCHSGGCFKNFVLSQCYGVRGEGSPRALACADERWSMHFDVVLTPNPRLSEQQRKAVERTYLMIQGEAVVPVRYALLGVFNQRFAFEFSTGNAVVSDGRGQESLVVIANRAEFERAMAESH